MEFKDLLVVVDESPSGAQRLDLAQQSQTERIQQNVVDETLDIDAASTAIAADAANTSALQLAVNTLTDQLKGSEQELQQVRDAILREKLREELQELQIDARIVEERIVSLKKALHPVCLKMDALRSHGFDLINWKLNDSQTFFKMWLLDSVGEMPGCKTGLDVFLKRESWAETLPQPDQADSVRLTPYPEPKPIPTWSGVA
jgi:hypothetical protein